MKKKNPDSETSILSPLVEFLEICSNQGRLKYLRAHPIRLISRDGKRFPGKIRASQKGAPDIFIWLAPNGAESCWDCWIEGKSATGKPTADQILWREYAHYSGIQYFQPKSHSDINEIINWIRERISPPVARAGRA